MVTRSEDPHCGIGADVMEVLKLAFAGATISGEPTVTTAMVLVYAARFKSSLLPEARSTASIRMARESVEASAEIADLEEVPFACVAALRAAAWRGGQVTRKSTITTPSPSRAVFEATSDALAEASSRGVVNVGLAHLVIGLLSRADNAAFRLLVDRGVDPVAVRERFRRSAEVEAESRPWVPLVVLFEMFGAIRGRDVFTRLAGAWMRRGVARNTRYGHPVLYLFRDEVLRQAVIVGDSAVSTVHVLLAVAQVDVQLAMAGVALPSRVVVRNTATEILRQHGFDYHWAVGQVDRFPEVIEPADPEHGPKLWRSGPRGDPQWGQRAVMLFETSQDLAAARQHPDVGTTHLLSAMLADSECAAVELLRSSGIDIAHVAADVSRDLARSDP